MIYEISALTTVPNAIFLPFYQTSNFLVPKMTKDRKKERKKN